MATNITGVRHVGKSAKDPITMSRFFQDVIGMKVIADNMAAQYGRIAPAIVN